jgi:hypothetical protein
LGKNSSPFPHIPASPLKLNPRQAWTPTIDGVEMVRVRVCLFDNLLLKFRRGLI